jgi:hypothetical protein
MNEKIHWKWHYGDTFCGKKAYRLRIARRLKDVTCKKCQQVYKKCEREGYWDE